MYVIMSNNGPWEFDSVGAVGAISNMGEFPSWVLQHMEDSGAENFNIEIMNNGFDELLDREELNYYSAGETRMVATVSEEDCIPTVYFLEEF